MMIFNHAINNNYLHNTLLFLLQLACLNDLKHNANIEKKIIGVECGKLTKINVDQDKVQWKLAKLHYFKVNILGSDYNWRALHDSGSEVDVIDRHKLMQCYVPHEVVGHIALSPMAGPALPAQLIKIKIWLADLLSHISTKWLKPEIHIIHHNCQTFLRNMRQIVQVPWPSEWLPTGYLFMTWALLMANSTELSDDTSLSEMNAFNSADDVYLALECDDDDTLQTTHCVMNTKLPLLNCLYY